MLYWIEFFLQSPSGCIICLCFLLYTCKHVSSEGEGIGEKMVITFVNLNVPNCSTNVGIYTKIYTKLCNHF